MATRFRPHTVQLQECFCCSFIFFSTASFSTLTRDLRSSSLSDSQNNLIRSRSSWEDVFHIFSFDIPDLRGGGTTGRRAASSRRLDSERCWLLLFFDLR